MWQLIFLPALFCAIREIQSFSSNSSNSSNSYNSLFHLTSSSFSSGKCNSCPCFFDMTNSSLGTLQVNSPQNFFNQPQTFTDVRKFFTVLSYSNCYTIEVGIFCNFHFLLLLVILFVFYAGLIVSTMLPYSLLETTELSREGKLVSSS